MNKTFWKQKKLQDMNDEEWESLCDRCGRCCLHKLEDADTLELHFTQVVCQLFDIDRCQCSDYEHRFKHVPDCISLRLDLEKTQHWLPSSCAYRLLSEGTDLPDWHPLVSGTTDTVAAAGKSICHFAIREKDDTDELMHHIIELN